MWGTLISNIFSALGGAFKWVTQRDAEKNTPVMQSAAAAKQEQGEKDVTDKAIAKQNTGEIQDELAE